MIVSEILDLKFDKDLTQETILNFFEKNQIYAVKWYIVSIFEKSAKIFVASEKKTL